MTPRRTALADQLEAATDDARHTITAAARTTPGMTLDPGHLPTWVHDRIIELSNAILTRQAQTCAHIATTLQPAYAAAWKPGLVACRACAVELLTAGTDTSCDRCGTTALRLRIGAVNAGPMLYHFALCAACATALNVPAAPTRTGRNQPCPCGSSVKYKRCHGQPQQQAS